MGESVPTKAGPSRGWYVLAGALFLAALCGVVWEILFIVSLVTGGGEAFLAPGKKTLHIEKPGHYVIWLKSRTFYNGKEYSSEPVLPGGATIKVFAPGGGELAVKADMGATMQSGDDESHSICNFDADRRGEYAVEVAGLQTPRVLVVQKSEIRKTVATIAVCTLAEVLGFLVAPAIVAVVAVLRWRARKK